MKYTNPIIPGFYPDPSICKADGRYYMVCSSFQYFPGVPLFESEDLINWKQIGHVLTRESQLPLEGAGHDGGIYAPTIRYHERRFYMVTTNVSSLGNFYVWTDDIHGEWSEPIQVQQGGIDPSLYFEDGKTYFMSNGDDDRGISGVTQCEIDIETGAKLSPSVCIWQGAGGRYLESPHLYKIRGQYYLMAAEGGTEYGHMVVYGKGPTVNGPFTNYPGNPVLTNRNLGGYVIQGCGHADLIEDEKGNFWMVHLAFRQIHRWMTFHITGREVCLVPVTFGEDGWFTAGVGGITPTEIETDRIPASVEQHLKMTDTFADTHVGVDWCFLRRPHMENYSFANDGYKLYPTNLTLEEKQDSPTFVAIRQRQMQGHIRCKVHVPAGEAGISLYMNHEHHYDLAVRRMTAAGGAGEVYRIMTRSMIGGVSHVVAETVVTADTEITLLIELAPTEYGFCALLTREGAETRCPLGRLQTRYLSSEVACGFTGVMAALYAQEESLTGRGTEAAEFTDFEIAYDNEATPQ
ncbi:MAG: glycoside hydrolase family 43 protein [Acetatifactor sp.]|nr:glycoside hydrolase family 43 protein [Acetatifactor sp.]